MGNGGGKELSFTLEYINTHLGATLSQTVSKTVKVTHRIRRPARQLIAMTPAHTSQRWSPPPATDTATAPPEASPVASSWWASACGGSACTPETAWGTLSFVPLRSVRCAFSALRYHGISPVALWSFSDRVAASGP